MPLVTVLTPTYERAATLPRLYASLREQTFTDFEWLVVDDGSTDATPDLVGGWAREAPFAVRLLRQENRGKHAALNRGVPEAQGTYCAVIDSDDWYVPAGLERLVAAWDGLPAHRRDAFANVEGLAQNAGGGLATTPLPRDPYDADYYDAYVVGGLAGDTKGMHRTAVLREHPFPEDLGRFVPEAIVWNRIARRYLTRFFGEVVAVNDYRAGGLSDRGNAAAARVERAAGAAVYHRELLEMRRPMPFGQRLRSYANCVRYGLHRGAGVGGSLRGLPRATPAAALGPVAGVALYARDRAALRRAGSPLA